MDTKRAVDMFRKILNTVVAILGCVFAFFGFIVYMAGNSSERITGIYAIIIGAFMIFGFRYLPDNGIIGNIASKRKESKSGKSTSYAAYSQSNDPWNTRYNDSEPTSSIMDTGERLQNGRVVYTPKKSVQYPLHSDMLQNNVHNERKYDDGFQRFEEDYAARQEEWERNVATNIIRAAGLPHPDYGYFNMPKWRVSGKKKSTGRKNTIEVRAVNEEKARERGVVEREMIDPITVELLPLIKTSYSQDLGMKLPEGTGEDDEWQLCLSIGSGDTDPIPWAFYNYMTKLGVPASRLSGRNSAASKLLNSLDDSDKAVLYIYAVDCDLQNAIPGDISESPKIEIYEAFSQDALKNPKIMTSIKSRPGSDIWKPNKKTIAYQFAVSYLSNQY